MENAGIGHEQKPGPGGPPPPDWRGDRPPHDIPRDMFRDDIGRGGPPPPSDFDRGRPPMRDMRGPPIDRGLFLVINFYKCTLSEK